MIKSKTIIHNISVVGLLVLAIILIPLQATASDIALPKNPDELLSEPYTGKSYSPYAERDFPSRPLWGDTHLHTGLSFDAGAFGNRLMPEDAYRFARGEEIVSSTGIPVRLSRPLDWLVVSDHSDNMGFFTDLFAGAPHLLAEPKGKDWYDRIQQGKGAEVAYEMISLFANQKFPKELEYLPDTKPYKAVWDRIIKAADDYNDPGQFTAFIGYEHSGSPKAENIHRNVMFKNTNVPLEPLAYIDYSKPENLWRGLDKKCTAGMNCEVLTIPHNSNVSGGRMFRRDKDEEVA